MKFDYYEYTISEHFLPAIINDDYSGFDNDSEEAALIRWLETVPVNGHWDIVEDSDNFNHCQVTDLYSRTVIVRRYFPITEAE
jgi:hypothetical protein